MKGRVNRRTQVGLCLIYVRLSGSDVCELPLQILLEILETFEGNFELVGCVERRRVVENLNVQNAYDRHCDFVLWEMTKATER